MTSTDVEMKAIAVMILSNIVSEEENSELEDTGEVFAYWSLSSCPRSRTRVSVRRETLPSQAPQSVPLKMYFLGECLN